jgi:hypothetical protein
MESLIKKGGLYGEVAELYRHKENVYDQYIIGCFNQCHNKSCWDHWGSALIMQIITYRLNLIRIPLKETLEELRKKRKSPFA